MDRLPPVGLCPGNEAVIRRSLELGGRLFSVPVPGAIALPAEVVSVPYNLLEQKEANARLGALGRAGKRVAATRVLAGGLLAASRLDPKHAGYRALARNGRTLVQAAILFVLANEAVECAIIRVTRPEHVEEVLRAPDVEPLSGQDLELIFELWANRFE
jgi:aryl-alcohol dehydrogenase-like predicted oxidoreductase